MVLRMHLHFVRRLRWFVIIVAAYWGSGWNVVLEHPQSSHVVHSVTGLAEFKDLCASHLQVPHFKKSL